MPGDGFVTTSQWKNPWRYGAAQDERVAGHGGQGQVVAVIAARQRDRRWLRTHLTSGARAAAAAWTYCG